MQRRAAAGQAAQAQSARARAGAGRRAAARRSWRARRPRSPGPASSTLRLDAGGQAEVVRTVLRRRERFGRRRGRGRHGAGRIRVRQPDRAAARGPRSPGGARRRDLGAARGAGLEGDARVLLQRRRARRSTNLALSVQARARGSAARRRASPKDGYHGEYIARDRARTTSPTSDPRRAGGYGSPAGSRWRALRREQDDDLKAFGVRFDNLLPRVARCTSTARSTATVERADRVRQDLRARRRAVAAARPTYGDDKDRVMRKSDGSYTYFVPDVAYHVTKWERGFAHASSTSRDRTTTARWRGCAPACRRSTSASPPDTPTTCCTRW